MTPRLFGSLRDGMLLLAERNFAAANLIARLAATKADLAVFLAYAGKTGRALIDRNCICPSRGSAIGTDASKRESTKHVGHKAFSRNRNRIVELIHFVRLPVVCTVRSAVGQGCDLAPAADFAVASAAFRQPFLPYGVSTDPDSLRLSPSLAGIGQTRLLLGESSPSPTLPNGR